MTEELLIPTAEALTVAWKRWREHGRIAVARMMIERGWPPSVYIVPCGFKSIVDTLLLDRLVVERRWRRRCVDRLRVGTTGKQR